RGDVDGGVVHPRVACAALSPSHGSRSLLRAHLWLASDDFSVGAARSIYMGFSASVRGLRSGEGCTQHFAFPRTAGGSPGVAGRLNGRERPRKGFHGNTDSPPFF